MRRCCRSRGQHAAWPATCESWHQWPNLILMVEAVVLDYAGPHCLGARLVIAVAKAVLVHAVPVLIQSRRERPHCRRPHCPCVHHTARQLNNITWSWLGALGKQLQRKEGGKLRMMAVHGSRAPTLQVGLGRRILHVTFSIPACNWLLHSCRGHLQTS